jgi:hypothetical protein
VTSSTASYITNAGLFEEDRRDEHEHDRARRDQHGDARGYLRDARFPGGDLRDGIGPNLGRIDAGIRLGGFEQHDGRLPEYGFTGGGTLDLADPTSFYGEVSRFAAGDTVELLGSWAFSGFSENSGGALATLTLVNGTTMHAFDFVGDYTKGDFKITSGATSTITHT